ncbi:MAG: hypothetical protein ACFE9Q_16010 [Candidatus Hodarchaeota archaeon]
MRKEPLFIIGSSSLAISLIIAMFLPDLPLTSFFEGMFIGISLSTNICFLIKYRLEKNSFNERNKRQNETRGNQFGD